MTTLDALTRLRRGVIEQRKIVEQLQALAPAPAPIVLDGLPHGAGRPDAAERLIDARDALTRKLHDLKADTRALYLATEPFMYDLPGDLYITAVSYYVDGFTIAKTAELSHIALRTAYERLSKIRALAAGKPFNPENPDCWR